MDVSWEAWSDAIAAGVKGVPDEQLVRAAEVLRNSSLVVCAGNGGSSSLASHAAQALMKPDYAAGGATAAVCLTDMTPALTAHANDGGWGNALMELAYPFLRMTLNNSNRRTTLLLFSSSGRSENIRMLAATWREHGLNVVAFTGFDGEPLKSLATVSIHVDSHDYEVVEPVHDALMHRVQFHLRGMGVGR
jgi:D-sedoheptulose 7-phosphate isomerase